MQAALSACQRLRHLALCLWLDPGRRSPSPSASVDWGFIAEISQALPSLRALEFHFGHYDWQDPDVSDKEIEALVDKMSWKKYHDMGTVHFDQAFVARVASREGTGLQLLQLEVGFAIGQESCMRLPASLRYLSTSCRCAQGYAHVQVLVQMQLCSCKHCLQARLKVSQYSVRCMLGSWSAHNVCSLVGWWSTHM